MNSNNQNSERIYILYVISYSKSTIKFGILWFYQEFQLFFYDRTQNIEVEETEDTMLEKTVKTEKTVSIL